MAHLSRARTLIDPLFFRFFSGASRRLDASRSDDATAGAARFGCCGCRWCGQRHQTHMGDRPAAFCQGTPTASPHPRPLSQREKGGTRDRVPETPPCPLLAVQSGRLTWASGSAAWSRRFAGRQVRCRLNRRAAVATSLQTPPAISARRPTTRDKKNPRIPYGRPIKSGEVGRFPYSESECG